MQDFIRLVCPQALLDTSKLREPETNSSSRTPWATSVPFLTLASPSQMIFHIDFTILSGPFHLDWSGEYILRS